MSEWPANIVKCLCGAEPTGETRLCRDDKKYEHRIICENVRCGHHMEGDWMATKHRAMNNWNHIVYMNRERKLCR